MKLNLCGHFIRRIHPVIQQTLRWKLVSNCLWSKRDTVFLDLPGCALWGKIVSRGATMSPLSQRSLCFNTPLSSTVYWHSETLAARSLPQEAQVKGQASNGNGVYASYPFRAFYHMWTNPVCRQWAPQAHYCRYTSLASHILNSTLLFYSNHKAHHVRLCTRSLREWGTPPE